jgi:hypothetical protein
MKNPSRTSLLLATAAVVAVSCSKIEPITAPALTSGRADFSVVAALGAGITAGFQSGGLADSHQVHSYASLFASQVGAHPLDLPLIGGAGIPPLLEIKRLVPPPIQIGPISSTPGNATNSGLATAYHNLGVPGALLRDMTDTRGYPNNPYFALIERGRGSIARQAATQLSPPPTFLLFEYGSSELLGPALQGTTVGLLSVAGFADSFAHALDTLATLLPGASMAVVNVPDVTILPFFTTLSNMQLDAAGQPVLEADGDPKLLLGVTLKDDLVLLSAASDIGRGIGYPTGTFSYLSGSPVAGQGVGLTNAQVLSGGEAPTVRDRARKYNSVIDTSATRRGFVVVDLYGLLGTAKAPGIEIRRVLYTSEFVTGGLIGLDGVYPNDLAHALLCNELIRAVNTKFGSNIQPVDPLRFATLTSSRASGSRAEGGPSPIPR